MIIDGRKSLSISFFTNIHILLLAISLPLNATTQVQVRSIKPNTTQMCMMCLFVSVLLNANFSLLEGEFTHKHTLNCHISSIQYIHNKQIDEQMCVHEHILYLL